MRIATSAVWRGGGLMRAFHSRTRLDTFVTTFDDISTPPLPVTTSSNSLLSYMIAEALKNLLPTRIQDEYEVNFSSSAASSSFLTASPSETAIEHKKAFHSDILGSGRFGTIRRCRNLSSGAVLAVKTQKKKYARKDPESGEFYEVEAMKQLPLGNFQLIKVYETPLKLHLVTELLKGPSFFEFWESQNGFEPVTTNQEELDVARHVRRLCEAMYGCEQAG
jgi:hypothetical protein